MTLCTSPGPARQSSAQAGKRSRQAEGAFDPRDVGMGIVLVLMGCGVLGGLFQAAETLRFDTLLVASKSIYNVISGMHGIGLGIGQMLLGLTQMLGFAALAALSVAAALSIFSGAVRIGTHTLPRLSSVWILLSRSLHLVLQFLAIPLSGGQESPKLRSKKSGPTKLEQPRRSSTASNRRAA